MLRARPVVGPAVHSGQEVPVAHDQQEVLHSTEGEEHVPQPDMAMLQEDQVVVHLKGALQVKATGVRALHNSAHMNAELPQLKRNPQARFLSLLRSS